MKSILLKFVLFVFATVSADLALAQAPAASAASPAAAAKKKGFADLNAESFDKMRQDGTNVVLDVRTKEEYDKVHIPGSIHLDFNSPEFEQKVAALDKSKTYLVHCASGGRSSRACAKMTKLNFKSLYNLEGGITGWEKAGKPVEKGK